MLLVYLEAPFAAFRTFTAGWYRPTATFLTPSAAYGLLLNLAGIESRLREGEDGHDGKVPASLTRPGLPAVEIAVGVPEFRLVGRNRQVALRGKDDPGFDPATDEPFPRVQTVFQQLHNYPVGASGADRAESTKGNKYNITPVRREFLSGVRAVVAVKGNDDLADRARRALAGQPTGRRYGVPFLGDNAFLLDRLEELTTPGPVRWYERVTADSSGGVRDRAARLTVHIDRADLSRTVSHLYAPRGIASEDVPPDAWTDVPPKPPE